MRVDMYEHDGRQVLYVIAQNGAEEFALREWLKANKLPKIKGDSLDADGAYRASGLMLCGYAEQSARKLLDEAVEAKP